MGFYYDGTVGLPDARRTDEVLLRMEVIAIHSSTFQLVKPMKTYHG